MSVRTLVCLAFLTVIAACVTDTERRRRQDASLKEDLAREMRRVCALPQDEREAEIEKISDTSGVLVYCGGQ